jgi:hypothetical protein
MLAAVALGCAPNVGTINRVQPNVLDKQMFDGIWYYKATLVSTDPAGQPGTFETLFGDTVRGYSGNMDKVRWEITQDLLIGYRSYEFVPYAEGLNDVGRDYFGSPVVAYKILSHFDIERDYNRTTGVENNVIVENTTDRPWNERRYMRVDWSKNVVGSPTLFGIGFSNFPDAYFSGTSLLAYYTQGNDANDPNRPVITQDYFDVVNNYELEPNDYYCALMLLYNGVPRCGTSRAKARLSFRKVDPNHDYESLYYPDSVELTDNKGDFIVLDGSGRSCNSDAAHPVPGNEQRDPADCNIQTFPMFQAFGNFRIDRVAYDQERGLTRTGRIFLAGRFNIWDDSYDDAGALRPYAERKPVPIVYYTNVDFPPELVPAAQGVADGWNTPFMETVAMLQGMTTPDGKPDLDAVRAKYGQDFRMYVYRQNSCSIDNIVKYAQANDLVDIVNGVAGSVDKLARGNIESVCAAMQYEEVTNRGKTLDPKVAAATGAPMAFQWEREGDTRYNFQNYIQENIPGPWGVAQWGADPESGEYISAAANYYANAGDLVSQREVDRIQWLNGDLSSKDLISGDISRNSVLSRRGPTNMSIRDDFFNTLYESDGNLVGDNGASLFGGNYGFEDASFKRMFQGSDLERELLVTDEILRGFAGPTLYQPAIVSGSAVSLAGQGALDKLGAPTPGTVSAAALAAASPVNWGANLDGGSDYMTGVRELAKRAVEYTDFFDTTFAGLSDQWKGKNRDEIYQWLRASLYTAVELHEVGHTLSLRHNFSASMDPLNYSKTFWDKYWNAAITPETCAPGVGNPACHAEEYKYSSVMDYGFDTPTEGLHSIGAYDAAAIRFIYGQLMDVWDNTKIAVPDGRKYGSYARRCGQNGAGFGLDSLAGLMDWTSIPSLVGVAPGAFKSCTGAPACANLTDDATCNGTDGCYSVHAETPMDKIYEKLVAGMEANAANTGQISQCTLQIQDVNTLISDLKALPPVSTNVYDARKIVFVKDLINQEVAADTTYPTQPDPTGATCPNPSQTPDGGCPANYTCGSVQADGKQYCIVDDSKPAARGFNWDVYQHRVLYDFCPDDYAGYSPKCQLWDHGADFLEAVDNHIMAYDRDYIFSNFRKDAYSDIGWGNPRVYMNGLLTRRLNHMTNVFRYYLYTRQTAFNAPLFQKWAQAAYHGVNFLERMLQTPEPGNYCLDHTQNMYVPLSATTTACAPADQLELGLGYGQGKYFQTNWTNEYDYKVNIIGSFYDKLAAVREMTSSSGYFIRDLTDLFDRRAFTLGYLRAWEDPIIQRFSGLIRGDWNGYRPAVITDPMTQEKYVRYMPFFDEQDANGNSIRQQLASAPKIDPSWSYTLSYYALAWGIGHFSSINDASPEFYRFTKIALKNTPEDIDYAPCVVRGSAGSACEPLPMVEFTDPETLFTYRAPDIAARPRREFISSIPGYAHPNSWGIGADLLKTANAIVANYPQQQSDCNNLTGAAKDEACRRFDATHRALNEAVGYIDIVRRFNRRAELP